MGYWNTRGLRGSTLEDIINYTNEYFRSVGLGLIQKIPTPITPVEINQENRTITLAYFDKQSTVDYIGVVQGLAICFDAKDTALKSLPIHNIHEHQIKFMEDFQRQKGLSFLIVHFVFCDEYFFLPFDKLKIFWDNAKNGNRKSIPYSAFDKKYQIFNNGGAMLNYLEAINTYLDERQD